MSTKSTVSEVTIVKEYVKNNIPYYKIGNKYHIHRTRVHDILVKHGVKIKTNKDYRKYTLFSDYFEKIDTEEKANILGFIYADGYNNLMNNKLRIGIHKQDIDMLEKITKAIQPDKENPIRFTYSVSFRNKYKNDNKDIAYLVIYCAKICKDLNALGCVPNKSLIVKYPKIDPRFDAAFISGYFDGDGHISYAIQNQKTQNRGYAAGFCASDSFAQTLSKKITDHTGVYTSVRKKEKISSVHISGIHHVKKFMDWMYKSSPIKLDRKYNKYLDLCKYLEGR